MPELVISMEPANMEKTMKKKGMIVPDIETPEMEELKDYLKKMQEYIDKMNECLGGTEREKEIAKPDDTEEKEPEDGEEEKGKM